MLYECSMSDCYEDLEDFGIHISYLDVILIMFACFVSHVLAHATHACVTHGLYACYSALCTPPHNRYSTYNT